MTARRMYVALAVLVRMLACAAQPPATTATVRTLVIDELAYAELPSIAAEVSGGREVAEAFRERKFETEYVANVDLAGLTTALRSLLGRVHRGDVVILYYSGHAVQSDGENYILPTSFPTQAGDVDSDAFSVSRIEAEMEKAGALVRIIVLDACRPLAALSARYPDPGLAALSPRKPGTLYAYQAAPGQTVAETPGSARRFAQAMVEALSTPGLTSTAVFERVRRSVAEAVGATQVPFLYSTLVDDVLLTGPLPARRSAGEIMTNPRDGLDYVWIPPGTFQMGCVASDRECEADEQPRHPVKLSHGFWMGRTEVTVNAYRSFARQAKQRIPKGTISDPQRKLTDRPITRVTWDQAQAYCRNWAGGRLPTEAEWEYSARAGTDGRLYPWGDEASHDQANYLGTGGKDNYDEPAPVRSFEPNGFGLYDMTGNVDEWCQDYYAPDSYQQPEVQVDPQGPRSGAERVRRGGSYASNARQLRISYRKHVLPVLQDNHTGFRCVVEEPRP